MKIQLSSVMVEGQGRALAFHVYILGLVKQHDIPAVVDEARGNPIQACRVD